MKDVVEFHMGEVVYLRLDEDQRQGMITGLLFRQTTVIYYVSWGDRTETTHYPFELSREKRSTFSEP